MSVIAQNTWVSSEITINSLYFKVILIFMLSGEVCESL